MWSTWPISSSIGSAWFLPMLLCFWLGFYLTVKNLSLQKLEVLMSCNVIGLLTNTSACPEFPTGNQGNQNIGGIRPTLSLYKRICLSKTYSYFSYSPTLIWIIYGITRKDFHTEISPILSQASNISGLIYTCHGRHRGGGGVLDFGLDGGVPPGPRDPNPCLE